MTDAQSHVHLCDGSYPLTEQIRLGLHQKVTRQFRGPHFNQLELSTTDMNSLFANWTRGPRVLSKTCRMHATTCAFRALPSQCPRSRVDVCTTYAYKSSFLFRGGSAAPTYTSFCGAGGVVRAAEPEGLVPCRLRAARHEAGPGAAVHRREAPPPATRSRTGSAHLSRGRTVSSHGPDISLMLWPDVDTRRP